MQKSLLQDFQESDISPSTTTTVTATNSTTPTTTSGSMKRPLSPSSAKPSPVPEKTRKISPTVQGGYAKLPLPITFPSTSTTTLHRTMSEPISAFQPTNSKNAPFSPFTATAYDPNFLKAQFQETTNKNFPASSNALQGLLRSFSDPSSFSFGLKASESNSSQKQGLEKMKGIIKGIGQFCNEVISEEEEEEEEEVNEDFSEDVNNEDQNKGSSDSDNNAGEEDQEPVRVEKRGDCLGIQFNCPCGIGYEILLSGNDCYYKLT